MSYCRGGWNYQPGGSGWGTHHQQAQQQTQPCSQQSQKVSIGIVADSIAQSKPQSHRPRPCPVLSKDEEGTSSFRAGKEPLTTTWLLNKEHGVKVNAKVSGSSSANRGNVKTINQEESSRSRAGLYGVDVPMRGTENVEVPLSRPDVGRKRSVGFLPEQVVTQSGGGGGGSGSKVEIGRGGFRKEDRKDVENGERQEGVSVKNAVQQEQPKESLRMKLKEILGTGLLGSKNSGDGEAGGVGVNEEMPQEKIVFEVSDDKEVRRGKSVSEASGKKEVTREKVVDRSATQVTRESDGGGDAHLKPRQNSDTIETDSENPDAVVKKPVTRSRARRTLPARTSSRNLKTKSPSLKKATPQAKCVFSFADKRASSRPSDEKLGDLMMDRKESPKRRRGVNLGGVLHQKTTGGKKLSSEEELPAGRVLHPTSTWGKKVPSEEELPAGRVLHPKTTGSKKPPSEEELSAGRVLHPKTTGGKKIPSEEELPAGRVLHPKTTGGKKRPSEEELPAGSVLHTKTTGGKKLPTVEDFPAGGRTESPDCVSEKENFKPHEMTQDNYFSFSPSLVVKENRRQQNANSPDTPAESDHHETCSGQSAVPEAVHKTQAKGKSIFNDSCLFKSPSVSGNCSESSDETATPEDAYDHDPQSSMEEKEDDDELYTPDGRELDSSQSTKDDSAKKGYPENMHTSPETEFTRKPMNFGTKRRRSQGVGNVAFSPPMPTPEGRKTDDSSQEGSEDEPEDGFARVASLLGFALQKVKNKMMSMTNKRCSAILMSAAEEIQSQLQSVESQIQTDLGKLTSLSKSKRIRLEARLQEQQELLKVIYQKFKDEIHHYLEDCRGTVEALEAHQSELKGAIERQKASHRKLLLEAQTAVDTRLGDVHEQISLVHQMGKKKMLKLKSAIAGCLKDGNSN